VSLLWYKLIVVTVVVMALHCLLVLGSVC